MEESSDAGSIPASSIAIVISYSYGLRTNGRSSSLFIFCYEKDFIGDAYGTKGFNCLWIQIFKF